MTPCDRILSNVETLPWSGCWIFMGALTKGGYGLVTTGSRCDGTRKNEYAHRVVYEQLVGPIPGDMELDHVVARGCVSTACVNPDHLQPVTHAENIRRGAVTGCVLYQRAKTHCPKGHQYVGDNLKIWRGRRHCRTCKNAAQRGYRAVLRDIRITLKQIDAGQF